MADPFSVAGSAVGVVALGIKICEDFVTFTGHVKDGKSEILKMSARLDMLEDHLEKLQSIVTEVENSNDGTSHNPDLGITALATALNELRSRQRLAYPFKREELLFLKDLIQDLQQNLSVALQALQLAQQRRSHVETSSQIISLAQHTAASTKAIQEEILNVQSAVVDTVASTLESSTVERKAMMTLLTGIAASVMKLETNMVDTTRSAYSAASLNENASQLCLLQQQVPEDMSTASRIRNPAYTSRPCCPTCMFPTKITRETWNWSLLSFTRESLQLHSKECCHASYSKAHASLELRLKFCFYLLRRKAEVAFKTWSQSGFSMFAPSLRLWRIVPRNAPAFSLLRDLAITNDAQRCMEELQKLFTTHEAFPNDRLSNGQTLLHVLGSLMFGHRRFGFRKNADLLYTTLTKLVPFLLGAMGEESFSEVDDKGVSALSTITDVSWDAVISALMFSSPVFKPYAHIAAYRTGLTTLVDRQILEEINLVSKLFMAVMDRSTSELENLMAPSSHIISDDISSWYRHPYWIRFASYIGWQEGCELLLRDQFLPMCGKLDGLLEYAVQSGDPCTIQFFLRQRRKTWGRSTLQLADLEYAIFAEQYSSTIGPDVAHICQNELIRQRRRLAQLAEKYLPSPRHPTRDDRVLDAGARNVLRALARMGVKLKHYLHPIHASIYHVLETINPATYERLYIAGFRDVQATHFRHYPSVVPPLLWQAFTNSFRAIGLCKWLISKGAKLHETWSMLPLMTAWKVLTYTAGSILASHVWWWNVKFEMADYVLSLLMIKEKDNCVCPCSIHGCSTISLFIQGGLQSSLPRRQLLFLLTSWVAPVVRQNRPLATTLFRALTFWKLGLQHVCCNIALLFEEGVYPWLPRYGWNLRPQGRAGLDRYHKHIQSQQEEVEQEEMFLRDLLEDLVQSMERDFMSSGQDIVEFVIGSWSTKMLQVLQDLASSDHESYHAGREQLGVRLQPLDLSTSGLIGTVHLLDRVGNKFSQSNVAIKDAIPRVQALDERKWVMPSQDGNDDALESDNEYPDESGGSDDDIEPEEAFWKGFEEEVSSDDLSEDDEESMEDDGDKEDYDSDVFVDAQS